LRRLVFGRSVGVSDDLGRVVATGVGSLSGIARDTER